MRVVQHEIDAGTAGISAWVNKLTNTRHSIWLNNCIRGQDLDASALRGALFVLCGRGLARRFDSPTRIPLVRGSKPS
eukprot:scaffold185451_cov19-Tisochrysis_lutea.AAC.1